MGLLRDRPLRKDRMGPKLDSYPLYASDLHRQRFSASGNDMGPDPAYVCTRIPRSSNPRESQFIKRLYYEQIFTPMDHD